MNESTVHTTASVNKTNAKPPKGGIGGSGFTDASRGARRWAASILDVLAGVRSPREAADALSVSLVRYYQQEARALRALVEACEPAARGPRPNGDKACEELRRENERLRRECARYSALARAAQRAIGLPQTPAKPECKKGKNRTRRPAVRALKAANRLRPKSEAGSSEQPAATPQHA